MTVLRFILGDQLSHQIASLRDINIDTDIVLMAEVTLKSPMKHHKRKIAFLLQRCGISAEELRRVGTNVIYRRLMIKTMVEVWKAS